MGCAPAARAGAARPDGWSLTADSASSPRSSAAGAVGNRSAKITARPMSGAASRSVPRPAATPRPSAAAPTTSAADLHVPVSMEPVAEAAAARSTRRDARPRRAARTGVSAVSTVPVLPTPVPSNPVLSTPVPSTPAASTSEPGPIARFLGGLFPCDPRGRLITIYKGTHFAIPNSFGLFIQEVTGTGTFTANTVYDLKDEDQYDWNKFTGIAFTPLEPDRDSAMVGWRYNLVSQEFEIAPFYNVDKVRILPKDPAEVISVPADETFEFLVDYTGVTLTYGDETVFKPYPEGLVPNVWTAARVSGWFGGNEVAPRTVSYYLKLT